MHFGQRRSWIIRALALLLLLITLIPTHTLVLADPPTVDHESPVADARRASSESDEPALFVGPPGRTLVANFAQAPIGPGVRLTNFDRFDARGWIRGHVLEVDLATEGLSTDLLFPGTIAAARPLSSMAREQGAFAGVNADFFDINRTNAPLGAAIGGGELLKGPLPGWSNVAGVGTDRIGRLAQLFLEGTVTLPGGDVPLAALNQIGIPHDGIGLFTPLWGTASRTAVAGSPSRVTEVMVVAGKVAGVTTGISSHPIPADGFVLIGRERGADRLAGLQPGDPVAVRYAPQTTAAEPFTFAVGGNVVLVRDNQLPALDDSRSEPRTAVGFSADGKKMYLVAVDGRQTDSRGMTLHELGQLLHGVGAATALNLDGGGSTTLVARLPGETQADVINSPSDGSERPVPNGIGLFAAPGSGKLSGLKVAPHSTGELAGRVFPGLTRSFRAAGYDETYAPVAVDAVSWRALPSDVAVFEEPGVLRARKAGSAVVQAQIQDVKGTTALEVLGELARLETDPARLGLSGEATGWFAVNGYDAQGYAAPIEPADVRLEYDRAIVEIGPGVDGRFKVVPKAASGSTLVTISVAGAQAYLPITIGLEDVLVADFEDPADWYFSAARASGSIDFVPGRTDRSLQLSYDFTLSTATRAAYANPAGLLDLPGEPQRIGLWVNGDGQGAWLRAAIRDAAGVNYNLNLAPAIDWTGWRYVEARVPAGVQYPIRLVRFYPVEIRPARQYTGRLLFDDLVVRVTPSVSIPEPALPADPLVVPDGDLGRDRWTFAVLADSQFVARAPDSKEVRLAREALRQIIAAEPDFLIIDGDFVDTAYVEDFDLARRILEEEVGDRLPIFYIPGNHEIMGPGNLNNFLDEFERNRYVFDYRGTRFILMDSSTGRLRTSDFEQLVELKELLAEAAEDPAVKNVLVFAHHPTRDPLPSKNSQLVDPKEARLLEAWLSDFRRDSGGKGAAYIAGHAHTMHIERVEGVPYVVVAPSGKAPYAAPGDGGFYAWTLFGVDPTPLPDGAFGPDQAAGSIRVAETDWLRAEVRPLLERISIDAPASLAAGERAQIAAQGHQAEGLVFPLRYPASVAWHGSDNLFVGSGDQARRAAGTGQYAAVFDPASGTLTALEAGEVTLRVEANGVAAETTLTIR